MIKDIYWYIIWLFKKDKTVCPRCNNTAFQHGFFPDEQYYCTECRLWLPDHIKEIIKDENKTK